MTKFSRLLLVVIPLILACLVLALFLFNKTKQQTSQPTLASISPIKTVSSEAGPSGQTSPSPKPKPVGPVISGRAAKVPVLYYHYIANNPNPTDTARNSLSVPPDIFDEQMGYLKTSGYTPITLDTLYAGLFGTASLPAKPIVITIDDGYEDLYYNAYPILLKYHFSAVAFIPTGLIGTKYYASWEELIEMKNSGLIYFEAHSVDHPNLTSLSTAALESELTNSKETLQNRLGIIVNFMAYPYGISSPTVWSAARKAGYLGAWGTWFSYTQSEGTIMDEPRIRVSGQQSLKNFKELL